jgi:glycosyltransferase involved in cell wall biosynthesis
MTELVTVITPTIGRQSLKRALDSVADQTIPARHIVVLDRPEKEEEVRAMLPETASERVQLVTTRGGVGPAAARNLAVLAVRTPWLSYLDDDDWYEPSHLAGLFAELEARGYSGAVPTRNAKVFASSGFIFHRSNGTVEYLPSDLIQDSRQIGDYLLGRSHLRFRNGIVTPSLVLPLALALEAKWDENLRNYEDWDLLIRLVRVHGAAFVQSSGKTVNISQGSARSLSKSRSWHDAALWLELRREYVSAKAASDFLAAEVMRGAFAHGSVRGVLYCLARLVKRPPSIAAFIVGLSGAVRR